MMDVDSNLFEKLARVGSYELREKWNKHYQNLTSMEKIMFGSVDRNLREVYFSLSLILEDNGFRPMGLRENFKRLYFLFPASSYVYRKDDAVFCIDRWRPEENVFALYCGSEDCGSKRPKNRHFRAVVDANRQINSYTRNELATLLFGGLFCFSKALDIYLNSANYEKYIPFVSEMAAGIMVAGGLWMSVSPWIYRWRRHRSCFSECEGNFRVWKGRDAVIKLVEDV